MKIIKDNSQKEYKVKCTGCKSKFSFTVDEPYLITPYYGGIYMIECPACKKINKMSKGLFGYSTY